MQRLKLQEIKNVIMIIKCYNNLKGENYDESKI